MSFLRHLRCSFLRIPQLKPITTNIIRSHKCTLHGSRLQFFSTDETKPKPIFPGIQTHDEKFAMVYTCKVCNTRSGKVISKHSYYHGVVLIRCPCCENLHLIADRLGWFDDRSIDIEDILKEKGEKVKIFTKDNILELTENDLIGKSKKKEE